MSPSSPWFHKLLAIYYLIQGLLLIAVGVGGLVLVDQNQLLVVKQWLRVIRLDPENRFIHWLLTRILPVTNEMLEAFSVGSLCMGLRWYKEEVSGSRSPGPPISRWSWLVPSFRGSCIAYSTR